jgi:hypothetical protein
VAGAFALALVCPSIAAEMTAFQLVKEGNRYIGEQAKDRVVQIRSDKSVGTLEPTIWYVVYYDPTASLKATEVKFGAGRMLSVKRPMRLLEPISGDNDPLDRDKMKIDSDAAIKAALAEPLLKNLQIVATELELKRGGDLTPENKSSPVWRVELWAKKLSNPAKQANLGEIWLSAEDAKVLKTDINLKRVD